MFLFFLSVLSGPSGPDSYLGEFTDASQDGSKYGTFSLAEQVMQQSRHGPNTDNSVQHLSWVELDTALERLEGWGACRSIPPPRKQFELTTATVHPSHPATAPSLVVLPSPSPLRVKLCLDLSVQQLQWSGPAHRRTVFGASTLPERPASVIA
jgi:hypothetical protein